MADKRARKFKDADDQDIDLQFSSLNALQHSHLLKPLLDLGMTAEEASRNFPEELLIRKLVHLMEVYCIPKGEPNEMIYALCKHLVEEFVRGFRVLPASKMTRPAHRPTTLTPEFAEKLFKKIDQRLPVDKSYGKACKWIVRNCADFKIYKPASLAATFRKLRLKYGHEGKSSDYVYSETLRVEIQRALRKIDKNKAK